MNYDQMMQEQMSTIPEGEHLLLHACCAPCTSGCLEHIANHFKISILFYNPKSLFGKILTTIGIIIIVATIIMSVNIVFRKTTLYNFIIMLALIAAGAGFLLRWFLKRKN